MLLPSSMQPVTGCNGRTQAAAAVPEHGRHHGDGHQQGRHHGGGHQQGHHCDHHQTQAVSPENLPLSLLLSLSMIIDLVLVILVITVTNGIISYHTYIIYTIIITIME